MGPGYDSLSPSTTNKTILRKLLSTLGDTSRIIRHGFRFELARSGAAMYMNRNHSDSVSDR